MSARFEQTEVDRIVGNVLYGKAGKDDAVVNYVKVTSDGRLYTLNTTYAYQIAEGNIANHSSWFKIGYTGTVAANVESDIWSGTGVYTFPTSGIQMSVRSSSLLDNDNSGSTGAASVIIYYLNSNFIEYTETLALDGTNWVDTVATNIYRINGFRIIQTGSLGKSIGNITLVNKTTRTVVYGYITAGYNRGRNSCYTVPAGKTLYITQFVSSYAYSHNTSHYARIYMRATENEGIRTPGIFYPYTEVIASNSSVPVTLEIPAKIVEKADIKVSIIADYAGIAVCSLRGWLETY